MSFVQNPKVIVVLQRGWIFVGELKIDQAPYLRLENAQVVRKWGTTKGLGELAEKGPLPETKLEPTPKTTFHELTTIGLIQCSENW